MEDDIGLSLSYVVFNVFSEIEYKPHVWKNVVAMPH